MSSQNLETLFLFEKLYLKTYTKISLYNFEGL